jgi:ribosomal-protein-alanine N-acetyltransferase
MGVLIGDKTYRGGGLAGEIMPILEKFLKENFNIKKVILGVSVDNNAAHKAYIKNGFRLEESKKTA